jgi:hypothetical protein
MIPFIYLGNKEVQFEDVLHNLFSFPKVQFILY